MLIGGSSVRKFAWNEPNPTSRHCSNFKPNDSFSPNFQIYFFILPLSEPFHNASQFPTLALTQILLESFEETSYYLFPPY